MFEGSYQLSTPRFDLTSSDLKLNKSQLLMQNENPFVSAKTRLKKAVAHQTLGIDNL